MALKVLSGPICFKKIPNSSLKSFFIQNFCQNVVFTKNSRSPKKNYENKKKNSRWNALNLAFFWCFSLPNQEKTVNSRHKKQMKKSQISIKGQIQKNYKHPPSASSGGFSSTMVYLRTLGGLGVMIDPRPYLNLSDPLSQLGPFLRPDMLSQRNAKRTQKACWKNVKNTKEKT